MPNFEALRLHLSRLRHERGWTYDELSERSGVSRSTLISIETGSSRRSANSATHGSLVSWYRLALALDIDLGELLRPVYDQST